LISVRCSDGRFMVRLLLMQRAVWFSHIGTIVITRAASAADLLVAARHTPARQEAGARRPDVLPSSLGSFGNKKFSVMANRPVTITSCSFCNSRQGRPSSHIGIIRQFRERPRDMPLLSRYLRSGRQISRFPQSSENEKTDCGRPRRRRDHHHLGQRPLSDRRPPAMLDVAA